MSQYTSQDGWNHQGSKEEDCGGTFPKEKAKEAKVVRQQALFSGWPFLSVLDLKEARKIVNYECWVGQGPSKKAQPKDNVPGVLRRNMTILLDI